MQVITAFALILVTTPGAALAYIDPSAGSIVLQLVLGGIAGLSVIAKLYYHRIMTFLSRRGVREEAPATRESTQPPR